MSLSNVDQTIDDSYDERVQIAPGGKVIELSWVGALPLERKRKTMTPDQNQTSRSGSFSTKGWVLTSVFVVAMVVFVGLVTLSG